MWGALNGSEAESTECFSRHPCYRTKTFAFAGVDAPTLLSMSNRYSIKGKIGQGGLGAVYKAYDNNLGRDVALKRVLPAEGEDPHEMAQNLIKEAKTLSALQHPHIVTVYDVGEDKEGPYVVMELLKGETLDTTIKRGALPAEDFQQVVIQSLEALVAAQALGITHRDLKPANVMVIWLPSGKFQIKILDFGLAKFSHQPSVQTIDQSDSILGSIYFMAPEQFERLPLDPRTDLYSIGAIYYYTLTGQYPFSGGQRPAGDGRPPPAPFQAAVGAPARSPTVYGEVGGVADVPRGQRPSGGRH